MTNTIVRDDGVLLVTAIGELTLTDAMLLRAQVRRAWLERPTRAALYDYRFATFDLRAEDWSSLYAMAARWNMTECATNAIVASPQDFSAFMARGSRYAAIGVCYAVFTDYDLALRWARENPLPMRPPRSVRR